jgi:ribosomal protein S6E (S10)
MSVLSWRELPRINRQRIGESVDYERRFVLTLNDPDTASAVMVSEVGVEFMSAHPEFAAAKCYDVQVNEAFEGNRYHAELIARYEVPSTAQQSALDLLPWLRPDEWTFQTQGVAVPALTYIDDSNDVQPLTNSAGDFFEGLTVDEAQQKIIIKSNREEFPSALAAAVTNCINDDTYLGFGKGCVKVQGISAEQKTEIVGGVEARYWRITSELLARQTGWNLLIPDVGFNYIEGGERKRATVKGPDSEDLPSSNPVALDGSGGLQDEGDPPEILERRVYKEIDLSVFFGTPPT